MTDFSDPFDKDNEGLPPHQCAYNDDLGRKVRDSLRGVVSLPPEFGERAELLKEVQNRYGIQG